MSDYYNEQLAIGQGFEAFVRAKLEAEGASVAAAVGKRAQLAIGDMVVNGAAFEVKFDRLFASTGNLYIETAEKRAAEQKQWTPSGVFSCSRAVWYGLGDYGHLFIFRRSELQREARGQVTMTIGRGTSQGFLLRPDRRAELVRGERTWSPAPPLMAADIKW